MGYDLMGQQCVLNSRHTDCTDSETFDIGPKNLCAWSAVYLAMDFNKHFDITRQKNVGGGRLARVGWGRGWEIVARTGLQCSIYVSERA